MEDLLIENVRKHEFLYNFKCCQYRDQQIRQAAWEEIANHLNISANEAKERWEKLRRCLWNAKKRRLEGTKSGRTYKKKSVWKYELQMDFLTPFLETRKKHSNLNNTSTEGDDIPDIKEFALQEEEVNVGNENADCVISKQLPLNEERLRPLKNRKRPTSDSHTREQLPISEENSERTKNTREESSMFNIGIIDEMDMFFLSISRMTEQLPKIEQAKIKLGLSNAVMSAEIRCQSQSQEQFRVTRPQTSSNNDYNYSEPGPSETLLESVNVNAPP